MTFTCDVEKIIDEAIEDRVRDLDIAAETTLRRLKLRIFNEELKVTRANLDTETCKR